jgi:hypothetical protein
VVGTAVEEVIEKDFKFIRVKALGCQVHHHQTLPEMISIPISAHNGAKPPGFK